VGPKERVRVFENIARLRRAERDASSPELAAVRHDLEDSLGGTVSRNLAARLLGVSHTALNNWVSAGDVPVVISERGRKEVPVPVLLDLYERVAEERESGRRKRHLLEPPLVENRGRAKRMRPASGPEFEASGEDGHRRAELRSLAYHRAIAARLRRPMVDEAARRVRRWREEGRVDRRYATRWLDLLERPVHEIRRVISADDQRGRDLRQSSPFAGLLSEPERRKILEEVR
jgi:hypothetical protein